MPSDNVPIAPNSGGEAVSEHRDAARRIRPRQRGGLDAYEVANEMVVLPQDSDLAYALNESGKEVFCLCDGQNSLRDMVAELRSRFEASDAALMGDISVAVFDLQSIGLVDIAPRAGGMGLISGRKAFQRPMEEGVKLLNTIQDVYLDDSVTIA